MTFDLEIIKICIRWKSIERATSWCK